VTSSGWRWKCTTKGRFQATCCRASSNPSAPDVTTGAADGLGLGLFIAKAIAEAHGGGLEVDSSCGATMFRMVLPRHTAGLQMGAA